jgi:hypothetical protein
MTKEETKEFKLTGIGPSTYFDIRTAYLQYVETCNKAGFTIRPCKEWYELEYKAQFPKFAKEYDFSLLGLIRGPDRTQDNEQHLKNNTIVKAIDNTEMMRIALELNAICEFGQRRGAKIKGKVIGFDETMYRITVLANVNGELRQKSFLMSDTNLYDFGKEVMNKAYNLKTNQQEKEEEKT